MTSQKRYRHHQDSNNNNARFRDIPPRFKRQKSSSSPTRPPTPSDSHQSNQGSEATDKHEVDSPQPNSAVDTSSSTFYQLDDKLTGHTRPVTDTQQSSQVVISSPRDWKWPQKDNVLVSSPWDKIYQTSVDFQRPTHMSLRTHFGYETKVSPWASGGTTEFPEQYCNTSSPLWTSEMVNSFADQRANYSPVYFSNENQGTNQHLMPQHSAGAIWSAPASSSEHYPTSSSPTVHSEPPLPTKTTLKVKNNKEALKTTDRVVDYSDPDVRTIEMLRELERVADQKESENEGFGADRKSLVSHHLRMLMCAVDRYTEGIEDELAMTSRHDEVTLSSDSRGSTPGVSLDSSRNQSNEQISDSTGNKQEPVIPLWSPRNKLPYMWDEFVSPTKSCTEVSNQSYESLLYSSSQASPVMNEHKGASWDLWSSPTFDFSGVLMNQSSGISERKSLFQGQYF